MIKKIAIALILVLGVFAAIQTMASGGAVSHAPGYYDELRDQAAIAVFCAYVSWGGPQYATGKNIDSAILAADEIVKRLRK